jgi:hypothetical protein
MPPGTTLNAKNLETLGAERLAELLIEISTGDAVAKRRLRLELAGAQGAGDLAKQVRKRLASIGQSKSSLDWQRARTMANDLETQRQAIVDTVAKSDPEEALDLLWRFMALAGPVSDRSDDGGGRLIGVFHLACSAIGPIAQQAKPNPVVLADQVFAALLANDHGQFDGLIHGIAPALEPAGLEHLKARVVELSNKPPPRPAEKDRKAIGWASSGPIHADDLAERMRASRLARALRDIADAQGDTDAFIAQYDETKRKVPKIAAEIAHRLLAAGRPQEALAAVEAAKPAGHWVDADWEKARIAALEALGRDGDAQAVRWACFERSLSESFLRAYLKKLPDFEDVEAEDKALDYAVGFRDRLGALSFLISWPDLPRAARLVTQHAADLNGNSYEILTPAADALAGKHPLAATLALRAMIDFTLNESRSSRYKHAARHLADCAGLASRIGDFGSFPAHDAYIAALRRDHGRKPSFWSLVG